jgi:hypothetical protein
MSTNENNSKPTSPSTPSPEQGDDVHARFNAAFPWFDHARWAWSYDPKESYPSHWYAIRNAPRDAQGDIAIHMPGATVEQRDDIEGWLLAEFNPSYCIPGTHLLPKKMPVGHRHGSTLPPLR